MESAISSRELNVSYTRMTCPSKARVRRSGLLFALYTHAACCSVLCQAGVQAMLLRATVSTSLPVVHSQIGLDVIRSDSSLVIDLLCCQSAHLQHNCLL